MEDKIRDAIISYNRKGRRKVYNKAKKSIEGLVSFIPLSLLFGILTLIIFARESIFIEKGFVFIYFLSVLVFSILTAPITLLVFFIFLKISEKERNARIEYISGKAWRMGYEDCLNSSNEERMEKRKEFEGQRRVEKEEALDEWMKSEEEIRKMS